MGDQGRRRFERQKRGLRGEPRPLLFTSAEARVMR
jgi:ribosomal protein L44E